MSQPKSKLTSVRLDSTSELWDREYDTCRVIPSSTRMLPSKALVLFSELLAFREGLRVLDAGCGTGRNSIYLANKGCEVHALDFSEVALHRLRVSATQSGVRDRIFLYHHALQNAFPFEPESFDLVLDSYVFCHFTDPGMKSFYLEELRRSVRTSGRIFSSVFSVDDEYYDEFPKLEGRIVVDPHNGLTKQLYTEEEARCMFSARFDIQYFVKFQFMDVVLDRSYKRSLLVFILSK
jgi:SAM-dependent methyltransferase